MNQNVRNIKLLNLQIKWKSTKNNFLNLMKQILMVVIIYMVRKLLLKLNFLVTRHFLSNTHTFKHTHEGLLSVSLYF